MCKTILLLCMCLFSSCSMLSFLGIVDAELDVKIDKDEVSIEIKEKF
jgi:hypothetical protein